MDDLDQHRKKRLEALIASPPFNGDRAVFMKRAGLSKGRISQLLDPGEAFGERSAKGLVERLGLPDPRWFESGAYPQSEWVWPFALLTPDQLQELPPQHLETVEKVALDLWRLSKVPSSSPDSHVDTGPVPRKTGFTGTIPKPNFMKGGSEQRSQPKGTSRKAGNG